MATEFTPKETLEEKVVTNVHSILFWVDRANILGAPPEDPYDNPQFNHWEIPAQNWWAQNSGKYKITTWSEKPTEVDNIHTGISDQVVSIIEPNPISIYSKDQKINLKISNSGHFPLQKIDLFINNAFIDTLKPPFSFSFVPAEIDNIKSENELKIISYDAVYNRAENSSIFKVETGE